MPATVHQRYALVYSSDGDEPFRLGSGHGDDAITYSADLMEDPGDACDNCWYSGNDEQLDSDGSCPRPAHGEDPLCGDVCQDSDEGYCGDGIRTLSEQCDDGNIETGDGCGGNCLFEARSQCADQFLAYWTMNAGDSDGLEIIDITGTHDATISGIIPAAGIYEDALGFDGSSTQITAATFAGVDFGATDDSISVAAWVRLPEDSLGGAIVDKRIAAGPFPLRLALDPESVRFSFKDATETHEAVAEVEIVDDEWHFIVAVRDGSTKQLVIWIDGVEEAREDFVTETTSATVAELVIGNLNGNPGDFYFDGTIDEVAIWDMALGRPQIRQFWRNRWDGMGYCQRGRDVICGDGLRDDPEQCDDGNLIPGDGCAEICRIER